MYTNSNLVYGNLRELFLCSSLLGIGDFHFFVTIYVNMIFHH